MKAFLINIIKLPDIRKRVIFTFAIIIIFRLLASVPIPGVLAENLTGAQNQGTLFFAIFTSLTGGQIDNPSVVAIGLAPYINASIMLQLLGSVIPKLEELQKEGERGRMVINQITRYLTLPLAFLQSVVIYRILNSQLGLVPTLNGIELAAFYTSLAAGTLLLMWLGELVTESGIGNGPSVVITLGILASFPGLFFTDLNDLGIDLLLIMLGIIVLIFAIIVYMNEAQRRVPIQYARRVRGGTTFIGKDNFLPIKLAMAGVMPVIFASSIIAFPQIVFQFLQSWSDPGTRLYDISTTLSSFYADGNVDWRNLVYFFTIIAFTFFYTFIIFKPKDTADNLKKSGGFIPGIRPGKSTEDYLTAVVIRLTVVGSLFLATIAILPSLARFQQVNFAILSGIGGTSLLIVVSVVLDMYRQTRAMMVTRSYDEFK